MKKIIILIPVFNDWESLMKLLKEIDENIKDIKNISFNVWSLMMLQQLNNQIYKNQKIFPL